MRASIFVFYIAVLVTSAAVIAQGDPDALYRERTDVAKARQAVAIWSERLAKNPRDFESAWKLARAAYWLGWLLACSVGRNIHDFGQRQAQKRQKQAFRRFAEPAVFHRRNADDRCRINRIAAHRHACHVKNGKLRGKRVVAGVIAERTL